ncbi:MAG: hypothetical protein Q8K75_00725 [Chlamydiales bacterium]|nr:hypothetical protein [Chlamydiales bacterium]
MKHRFTLLPLILFGLTSCSNPIDQMVCVLNESTEAINTNRCSVERSTEVICENRRVIGESTVVIIENHKQLQSMHD